MDEDSRIVALSEVPTDGTLLFTVRDGFDKSEAILTRLVDGVVAWKNYCPHWTDVRLDKGSGALVRDGEIVCQKHGATFQTDDGFCTHGPCEGAYLDEVEVTVEDDVVYLTDDRYEFANVGPSGEHDLSSRGRIDFSGS
ncbi:Rieske 2Fe-2S domain-containing protein [Haloarculaceae archaeon H-GB2-1]|nr:Rieske 2Fe-2S domain-containing protein [Haloarculaceae archaeon H-GB1-1]MEA5386302.1 Rieske 2Fe-2S domain-containing protein [Haloarculaceae archaeon H-GB11]MEA5407804.1 Rieske 2Fe-2S domain-containing protein [Haloarculaceae archaeon H-GB2-1]